MISNVVEELLNRAVTGVPPDVLDALKRARKKETNALARGQLDAILENLSLDGPICQDTGMPIFFVEGPDFRGVEKGIHEGVSNASETVPLRPNAVDPLSRENLGNLPIIYFEPGEELKLTVLPKGAGSENMSALFMLKPAQGLEGIREAIIDTVKEKAKNACPPIILGIGIGGTAERAMLLSKLALTGRLDERNGDMTLDQLEQELLKKINKLGIGVMGLGGDTTCLGVRIRKEPCHTASLPLAITIQCWADRRASAVIRGDRVDYS